MECSFTINTGIWRSGSILADENSALFNIRLRGGSRRPGCGARSKTSVDTNRTDAQPTSLRLYRSGPSYSLMIGVASCCGQREYSLSISARTSISGDKLFLVQLKKQPDLHFDRNQWQGSRERLETSVSHPPLPCLVDVTLLLELACSRPLSLFAGSPFFHSTAFVSPGFLLT